MRIRSALLILSALLGTGSVRADSVCGVFKAIVYVPGEDKGSVAIASPKAVSYTKLRFPGAAKIPGENLDLLAEIQFRSKSVCYRDCEVELVKVVRSVSPFEEFGPYLRSKEDLVKEEPCVPTPLEAIGL